MMNLVINDGYDYKQNDELNDNRFWILKIQFIDPVHKTFYILLEGRTNTEANYITDNIRDTFISMGVVEKSLLSEISKCEFDKWYSVAYSEDILRVCKKPLHLLKYMVLRSLEGRAKLGLGISEIIHIYHSIDGIVDACLKSIKNQLDKEEETMSDKVSPALSKMSTKYYILRVNYLQKVCYKVCYIILGNVPGFKALKTVDKIRSYFEKNNIDISTSLFSVSVDMYQIWLQLLVSEDLIEMNSLDDARLSSIKRHATSIKYELEIEPNATIRSYTCDIPEIAENLFNEWFNDVSQSDKRKEKGMSDNTVSPALSKIEERIKQLKQLERDSDDVALDIQKHKNAIEELTFKLDELGEDILHVRDRIGDLCSQAMIGEGFTEEYIRQFLKERGFKKQ